MSEHDEWENSTVKLNDKTEMEFGNKKKQQQQQMEILCRIELKTLSAVCCRNKNSFFCNGGNVFSLYALALHIF